MSSIVAVIPAHNEEDGIADAVASVIGHVDEVLVVADNCTDGTVHAARAAGARVMETVNNTDRKAGALNQALRGVSSELILLMDADTVLSDQFVPTAVRQMQEDPELGAVGGIFSGDPRSILEVAQANEYLRYARELGVTGRVMVLSGTAAVVRRAAAEQVAAARGRTLPGRPGDTYCHSALTEDMELTLALKKLGWKLASPAECRTTTELMPTPRALWNQRVRWYRGALDNLRDYGWNPTTRRYWMQQAGLTLGVLSFLVYVVLMAVDAWLGVLRPSPFWLVVGAVFLADRIITAWPGGVRSRLVAASLLTELAYDLFLQAAYVRAAAAHVTHGEPQWHHLEKETRCTAR